MRNAIELITLQYPTGVNPRHSRRVEYSRMVYLVIDNVERFKILLQNEKYNEVHRLFLPVFGFLYLSF